MPYKLQIPKVNVQRFPPAPPFHFLLWIRYKRKEIYFVPEKKSTLSLSQAPALQMPEPICLSAAAFQMPPQRWVESHCLGGAFPTTACATPYVTSLLKAADHSEFCAAVRRGHQVQANRVTPLRLQKGKSNSLRGFPRLKHLLAHTEISTCFLVPTRPRVPITYSLSPLSSGGVVPLM